MFHGGENNVNENLNGFAGPGRNVLSDPEQSLSGCNEDEPTNNSMALSLRRNGQGSIVSVIRI